MHLSGKNRKFKIAHLRNYPGRIQYDEVDPFTEHVVFELDQGDISDYVHVSVCQFVFTDRARDIIEQHRLPDDDYTWAPIEVYRTSDRHTFYCHALRLPARDFLDHQKTGLMPYGRVVNPVVDEQKAVGISIYRQQGVGTTLLVNEGLGQAMVRARLTGLKLVHCINPALNP